MKRLKSRTSTLSAGGATNEALLLAAVYGIYELPDNAFPFVEQLFPKPRKPESDSSSWWDSSSSSSSSSSCGSSSGGSGCGGGGGGCGGGGGD